MTVSMFVRNKVKDFAVWKALFDSSAEFVKGKGVIASKVLQDIDDPNLVIVYHQFADTSSAKAFEALVNSDLFRQGNPVKERGVILETMEMWLGEEV